MGGAEQLVLGCVELRRRDDVRGQEVLQVLQRLGGLRVSQRMDLRGSRRIVARRGGDIHDDRRPRRRTKVLVTPRVASARLPMMTAPSVLGQKPMRSSPRSAPPAAGRHPRMPPRIGGPRRSTLGQMGWVNVRRRCTAWSVIRSASAMR